jgi:hypothetical protein
MALNPFEDTWEHARAAENEHKDSDSDSDSNLDSTEQEQKQEQQRWCGDVPRLRRAMQCSCSS